MEMSEKSTNEVKNCAERLVGVQQPFAAAALVHFNCVAKDDNET
jgi:hypothetical protein